jgi:non-ribosomal peptide synthetase component F
MIICILAVLKAGGAYVPLDHENPPERNTFIVGDVDATLVLTTAEHSDIFTDTGAEVVCVEGLDLRGSWPNVPMPGLTPENLAYIIYTSGSTGRK